MASTDRNQASSGKTGITERLKQDSRQKIESTKRSAADQIDRVAQALSRAGEELNQSQPTLANYASQCSSTVSTFAARLRDGDMDELLNDTRELARRNPGMFLAGGVALGFALSRFLKASGDEERRSRYTGAQGGNYGTEDYSSAGAFSGTESATYGSRRRSQDTFGVESSSYASGTSSARTRDDFSSSRSNGG